MIVYEVHSLQQNLATPATRQRHLAGNSKIMLLTMRNKPLRRCEHFLDLVDQHELQQSCTDNK
jgi:hypothetical protein